MKNIKKAIVIFLAFLLAPLFSACGKETQPNETEPPGAPDTNAPKPLEYKMTATGEPSAAPVIDSGHPDSKASGNYWGAPAYRPDGLDHGNCGHNMWGYENGHAVKTEDGVYHLLIVEFCDGGWGYTHIGYWTSADKGDTWSRIGTIIEGDDYQSGDGRSLKETCWAPTWFWDETEQTWNIFFRGDYRVWRCKSSVPGKNGIAGPYGSAKLLETGGERQWWDDGVVHGFSTVYTGADGLYYAPYSMFGHGIYENEGWPGGIMKAKDLNGPWERVFYDRPVFLYGENPLVYTDVNSRGETVYFCVYDDLADLHSIGFGYSEDGVNWTCAQVDLTGYVPWAPQDGYMDTIRTPCSMIKESDGTYTVIFTARDPRLNWYYSVGKVSVKIEETAAEPEGETIFPGDIKPSAAVTDADNMALWETVDGVFYNEFKEYSANAKSGGEYSAVYTGREYADFTIEAVLRCVSRAKDYKSAINNRNTKAGIFLRKPGKTGAGGYYIYLYAGGRIEVYADNQVLARHDSGKNAFMFRKIKAEAAGNNIKVYFEKELVIEITDGTYGAAGYIGAVAADSHWHYQKISVYE